MSRAAPLRPIALGSAEVKLAAAVLLCAAAITTGSAVMLGVDGAFPAMLVTGGLGLWMATAHSLRAERDWFNPLFLLVLTWVLRIAIPSLYTSIVGPPPEFMSVFHVPLHNWDLGLALALVGIASIALGWMLLPRATASVGRSCTGLLERTFRMDGRIVWVGLLFMVLGLGLIVVFLRLNFASSADAISSGVIRKGAARQSGTSRYAFLAASLVIYGSVAASSYLLVARRARWWVGMLPALVATVVMSIFGGRVLALTPSAYAGLALWYRGEPRRISTARVAVTGLVGLAVLQLYSIFIDFYRSGLGLRAARTAFSLTGLSLYASSVLWYEAGMIYPYAVATVFPPGVLKGQSLPLTLGIAANLLGLEGVRPGQFMVEALVGRTRERIWGWHSGLVIDLYMNYGLFAVVLGGILFGLLLHTVYAGFRAYRGSALVACFYVMLVWHFFWMFWEHTAATMNIVLINFPFVILALAAAQLLPERAMGPWLLRRPRAAPA